MIEKKLLLLAAAALKTKQNKIKFLYVGGLVYEIHGSKTQVRPSGLV